MANLTSKQEAFCLYVFQGERNAEAYRRAYDVGENTKPETIWNDAYKLRKHPEVSARIDELRAQAAEIGMVTVHSITKELDQARLKADSLDQPHNMIKATTEKARLHGLTPDRLEITGKDGGPIETADITDKEVARRLAFLLERGMRSDISES